MRALVRVLQESDGLDTLLDSVSSLANLSTTEALLRPSGASSATRNAKLGIGSSDYDCALEPRLVTLLGELSSTTTGTKIRCLVALTLYNFSCNPSNRELMVRCWHGQQAGTVVLVLSSCFD